ncbi:MAG: acyl-ACP--UDP-N-acetylglucosamine O-acyltransferase [Tepidisphaeraceae bacterium]
MTKITAQLLFASGRANLGKGDMSEIHPTAIVDSRAQLADDVQIGAYSIVKADVTLGPGTIVYEHCHIHGHTTIGKNCRIGPAAYVGLSPQHLKHDGRGTRLIIGDDVVIRETASIHRSINPAPEHATRVGDRCMLMVGCHVGHDCHVGADVVLANAVLLGGHITVGDKAFVGGGATIHQFVRIGRLSIIAGNEAVSHDVPPFSAIRYRGLKGYNAIGCKRSGMSRQSIASIRAAYHALHTNRTLPAALEIMKTLRPAPELDELIAFLTSTKRGIIPSLRFLFLRHGAMENQVERDD